MIQYLHVNEFTNLHVFRLYIKIPYQFFRMFFFWILKFFEKIKIWIHCNLLEMTNVFFFFWLFDFFFTNVKVFRRIHLLRITIEVSNAQNTEWNFLAIKYNVVNSHACTFSSRNFIKKKGNKLLMCKRRGSSTSISLGL